MEDQDRLLNTLIDEDDLTFLAALAPTPPGLEPEPFVPDAPGIDSPDIVAFLFDELYTERVVRLPSGAYERRKGDSHHA